jgi:hypothetical protein
VAHSPKVDALRRLILTQIVGQVDKDGRPKRLVILTHYVLVSLVLYYVSDASPAFRNI